MYEVRIPSRLEKRLARLPESAYGRVRRALSDLAQEPRPRGRVKLSGQEMWRVRIGDYRIIYAIDDEQRVVEILNVAHRRDVYRRG